MWRALGRLRARADGRRTRTNSSDLRSLLPPSLALVAASAAALSLRAEAPSDAQAEADSERGATLRFAAADVGASSAEKMRLTRRFTRRRQQRSHTFVIVGSGTAAHAAIEAIRQESPRADILVLSDESARPRVDTDAEIGGGDSGGRARASLEEQIVEPLLETYNEWRRHLTAKLEDEPSEGASGGGGSGAPLQQQQPPLTLLLDKKEMRFDVEKNRIHLGDGTEIRYEKCLIASPGRPRHFYVLDSDRISYSLKDRINLCTTLSDFAQLDQLHQRPEVRAVTVIGGGFLGTEVATALATDPRNAHITTRLVFTESAPTSRSLPFYLAQELAKKLESVGVEVVPDRLVTSLKCEGGGGGGADDADYDGVVIEGLGQGKKTVTASDVVVLASTHTDPNLRFGRDTCFEFDEVNGGIMVNAQLEAISGLFVAGNAASYFDPYLGRRRVDRYDHAVNSGLVAGRNMVASLGAASGKMKNYRHQPMFRSNLSGINVLIEGIGEIDSSLRTVGVWVQPRSSNAPRDGSAARARQSGGSSSASPPASFDRGVVYYLKGNKIMGILLWNASDVLDSAKQLMRSRPEIHDNVVEELQHVISIAPADWLHVVTT